MITVAHLSNPFEPHLSRVVESAEVTTIYEAKRLIHGEQEFPIATICLLNGKPILRNRWNAPVLKNGDIVGFAAVPGDVVSIIIAVVVAVIASVIVASLAKVNPPKVPGQLPEPDPVYSLNGQRNQIRLGYPIEVPYGRARLWPGYGAAVYTQYIDNDQWQFQLFCLGQGEFEIGELRIEDTPIENFSDVEYAVYGPGENVTLFPNNVVTSVEVNGLELFGPNEPEYTSWIGGYVATPAFTQTNRLEMDLVVPSGLYYQNDKGGLDYRGVIVAFEYREIDDTGTPTGAGTWAALASFSKSLAVTTPQRFTVSADVAAGRYEVRARRTDSKDTSYRAGNTVTWETLRGFLTTTTDFGDVTMLAVKARATNNLNSQSSNRFNLVATRKLPIWSSVSGWSEPTATRNPVWAFCDVLRSAYGANLAAEYIDLETLETLAGELDTRGDCFDWVFDQKTTVWEALKTIGTACRSLPVLRGSKASLIRDEPKVVPVGIFTPDNIVSDSFRWEIKLSTIEEYDGLEVMYQDEDTGKEETLLCVLADEEGLNPDSVRLPGVTQRAQAYREGLYLRASERYLREQVIFRTGYEGLIPTVGDLIAVSHDVPRWGATGFVLDITDTVVTLDDNVVFTEGETHELAFRKKDGGYMGPYVVTAGVTADKVVLPSSIDVSDLNFDINLEPTFFLFGVSNEHTKLCKITDISPGEAEDVEITASIYQPIVYTFDEFDPPVIPDTYNPPIPALPVVTGLVAARDANDPTKIRLSWPPITGAVSYVVQVSSNGEDWFAGRPTNDTFLILGIHATYIHFRVAAINVGQGPWAYWEGNVGSASTPIESVTGLALDAPFTGTSFTVSWTGVDGAIAYEVSIYQDGGATVKRTSLTVDTTFTYTIADAEDDFAPNRAMRVGVSAVNAGAARSFEVVVDVENPVPDALTGQSLALNADSGTLRTYDVGWGASADTDIAGYRVWGSVTPGFTPSSSNLIYDGVLNSGQITINLTGGIHGAFYWVVAAYDVWGTESFNYGAEQTIPAINLLVNNDGDQLVNNDGDQLKG